MSVELLRYPTYVWAALSLVCMVLLLAIFLIHWFVPKTMLRAYFKEPYFSTAEIAIFSAFPFFFMRTVMFMRLAGWPKSGTKRGLSEVHQLAPSWFRVISKVLITIFFMVAPLFFGLGMLLFAGFCYLGHC